VKIWIVIVGNNMANEGNKSNDFYAVLGLNKECSDSELRNAYKKLALVRNAYTFYNIFLSTPSLFLF